MPGKTKKGFWHAARKVLYAEIGLSTLLLTYYLGAKNPAVVRRLEDSLFYRSVPVAKDSFPDPAGLEVEVEVNERGAKEAYLLHNESGKKVPIGPDMLPKKLNNLAEGLENKPCKKSSSLIEPDKQTDPTAAMRNLDNTADSLLQSIDSAVAETGETAKEASEDSKKHERWLAIMGGADADKGFKFGEMVVSAGTNGKNFLFHGYGSSRESYACSGEHVNKNTGFFRLRFGCRTGGANASQGPKLRVELFGQQSERDIIKQGTAPVTTADYSGRFETTEQYLGGTERKSAGFISAGFNVESEDSGFFKGILYRANENFYWDEGTDILIRDLSGILSDINNQVSVGGHVAVNRWGIELMIGKSLKEQAPGSAQTKSTHVLIPFMGYEYGGVMFDNNASVKEANFSEFRLGAAYRLGLTGNRRLTAGGLWTSAEVWGEEYDAGSISLSYIFAPNDYLVLAPNAGADILDDTSNDSALWRLGITLAAGKLGFAREAVDAVDQYGLDNLLEDWSRQHTPEAEAIFNEWRFYEMLRHTGASFLLSLDRSQQYDKNAEKSFGGEARLALMKEISIGRKFILDGSYIDNAFERSYGGGLGYFGPRGYVRVGQERVEDAAGEKFDRLNVIAGFRF